MTQLTEADQEKTSYSPKDEKRGTISGLCDTDISRKISGNLGFSRCVARSQHAISSP